MAAGLYLRLSREDGEGESQSIANQRMLLTRYCREQGIEIGGIYIDDGYSGTTFDRPDFKRMLRDVEAGRLDTVITKDLSRLGRDYIMTGHYLERYFPAHDVRYIALGDGIDSRRGADDMTPFRAVVNDMYARDISRKVRAALTAKKQAGQFIGARPPYGYRRSDGDKNKLAICPDQAQTVGQMYRWALAGCAPGWIAAELTRLGEPPPSGRPGTAWSGVMVRRILTNPTYCGCLTQNRASKVSYKVERVRALPREQWITVEGTHAAIVPRAAFEAVQRLLTGRAGREHPLAGLVFCMACGAPMTFTSDGQRHYLTCSARRRGGGCRLPAQREEAVQQAVAAEVRRRLAGASGDGVARELARQGQTAPPDCAGVLADLISRESLLPRLLHLTVERVEVGEREARVIWRPF